MPKRYGFIKEKVLTLDNCTQAVIVGTANLRKTPKIKRIRENPEKYGAMVLDILKTGWKPEPCREKTINEGTRNKKRNLRIPTTRDHLCHVAIMLPIIPILERRFDYYSCGSIKGKGQRLVNNAIKGWMKAKKPPKYGGEGDVHHAYQSTTKAVVMDCLRAFIKDEAYLQWHDMILDQMGGVLAIGFSPSHWYFNLVMDKADKAVRKIKGIKYVRYMDNYVVLSNRKRKVHKALSVISETCGNVGLRINKTWQVYQTKKRAVQILSYRYFLGYTLIVKRTMYNITARIKTAARNMCAHMARGALSRIGITRHCNSYNYRKRHIYRVISIHGLKEVVSRADRKRILRTQAGCNRNISV